MPTAIEIDDDVLQAAQALAAREGRALADVVGELLRQALAARGVSPFPARGVVVTNELVDRLRDEGGI